MADVVLLQCNSCRAIYRPVQADGLEYYHACPSQIVDHWEPDPTKDEPDRKTPIYVDTPNRRDERIIVDENGVARIRAAGAGVTPVTDPAAIAAYLQQGRV